MWPLDGLVATRSYLPASFRNAPLFASETAKSATSQIMNNCNAATLFIATTLVVCCSSMTASADEKIRSEGAESRTVFEREVRPVLKEFCYRCHGPDKQKAELRLDTLGINIIDGPEAETWHDVLNNLNLGEMPPSKELAPSAEQRNKVVGWLTQQFKRAAEIKRSTGGRAVLRRLTRYEYNNTMRDLFGLDRNYAEDLPPEPSSVDGFKNNGSALGMSAIQIEYYLAAARAALGKAIVTRPRPQVYRHLITNSKEVTRNKNKAVKRFASKRLQGDAEFVAKLAEFPREGEFVIRVKATAAIPQGAGYPRLAVSLGVRSDTQTPEALVGTADVTGTPQSLAQPLPRSANADELVTDDMRQQLAALADLDAQLADLPDNRDANNPEQTETKRSRSSRKKLEREKAKLQKQIDLSRQIALDQASIGRLLQSVDDPQVYEFRGQIDEFPLPGENPKFPGLLVILRNVYDGKGDQVVVPSPAVTAEPEPDSEVRKKKKKNNAAKIKYDPTQPAILIESIEFVGPIFKSWPPVSHQRILFESSDRGDEAKYAKQVLARFMTQAWRRPATDDDVEGLLAFFRKVRPRVNSFEHATRETLAMVLISPEFLYLVEPQSVGTGDEPLDDFELASRLSYFLWSTMPDEQLLGLARSGELQKSNTLKHTVRRMIADQKSQQFVDNFTNQWLQSSGLDRVAVNPEYYPEFDDRLKPDMRKETQHFFAELLHKDLSALNLIDSKFTMVNRSLGRHYGLETPLGSDFQRVAIKPGDRRGGLLTHGSVLLSNSTGEDSHTIRRGVWLLDRLLGDPPAPPPPDVPELNTESPDFAGLSTRRQLEIHRTKESCNDCHRGIDPWGIPFEHYDAVGLWRDNVLRVTRKGPDKETPVDARAELPGGYEVNGLQQLKAHLLEHERGRFSRALVEKILSYSLGRSLEWTDGETIDALTDAFQNSDYKLSELIVSIVLSEAFRTR